MKTDKQICKNKSEELVMHNRVFEALGSKNRREYHLSTSALDLFRRIK